MKLLVVGGTAQGKLEYVCGAYNVQSDLFADGGKDSIDKALSSRRINKLHLLAGRLIQADMQPMDAVMNALEQAEDWVVICDEIGSGVVPIDAYERQWREETGRLCCKIAENADTVLRITCGIPIALKCERSDHNYA